MFSSSPDFARILLFQWYPWAVVSLGRSPAALGTNLTIGVERSQHVLLQDGPGCCERLFGRCERDLNLAKTPSAETLPQPEAPCLREVKGHRLAGPR